jgi:hypothetical protein
MQILFSKVELHKVTQLHPLFTDREYFVQNAIHLGINSRYGMFLIVYKMLYL